MTRRVLFFLLIVVIFTGSANAATYVVPDDHSTIQLAISAAATGDSIFVRQGVYHENLYIENKGLYISSFFTTPSMENMRETIIDGSTAGPVIWILNCADTLTVRGMTITNGLSDHGSGIRCSASNIKLLDMVIRDNMTTMSTWAGGGGIHADGQSFLVMNNVLVSGNKSYDYGAGISLRYGTTLKGDGLVVTANITGGGGHGKGGGFYVDEDSYLSLKRSVISDNIASKWGGAMSIVRRTSVDLVNVTMTGNFAGFGGGAIYSCYENSSIFLANCILRNNLSDITYPMDQEVYFDDAGDKNRIAFCYSDLEGGVNNMYIPYHSEAIELEGNIEELPYFNPDLTLASPSLCIDAGTDYYEYWGQIQVNIQPEQYWGAAPDMGAYENFDIIMQTPEVKAPVNSWINVYPNPAGDVLHVELLNPPGEKFTLIVYNSMGQRMMEEKHLVRGLNLTTLQINTSSLPSGSYVLQARSKGRSMSKKFVIERSKY